MGLLVLFMCCLPKLFSEVAHLDRNKQPENIETAQRSWTGRRNKLHGLI